MPWEGARTVPVFSPQSHCEFYRGRDQKRLPGGRNIRNGPSGKEAQTDPAWGFLGRLLISASQQPNDRAMIISTVDKGTEAWPDKFLYPRSKGVGI